MGAVVAGAAGFAVVADGVLVAAVGRVAEVAVVVVERACVEGLRNVVAAVVAVVAAGGDAVGIAAAGVDVAGAAVGVIGVECWEADVGDEKGTLCADAVVDAGAEALPRCKAAAETYADVADIAAADVVRGRPLDTAAAATRATRDVVDIAVAAVLGGCGRLNSPESKSTEVVR